MLEFMRGNMEDRIPSEGFIIRNQYAYRATAVAIMKKEQIDTVKHRNGKTYTLSQLQGAMITRKK